MPAPSDMTGKVALVTGAAGGLGKSTAIALARAGADLCIVDINADGLAVTAEAIKALGGSVLVQAMDIGISENCVAAVAATVNKLQRLDALCNVAAVFVPTHTTQMSIDDCNKIPRDGVYAQADSLQSGGSGRHDDCTCRRPAQPERSRYVPVVPYLTTARRGGNRRCGGNGRVFGFRCRARLSRRCHQH